ncbi:hypothetical protein [Azospirillum endophyticum]
MNSMMIKKHCHENAMHRHEASIQGKHRGIARILTFKKIK